MCAGGTVRFELINYLIAQTVWTRPATSCWWLLEMLRTTISRVQLEIARMMEQARGSQRRLEPVQEDSPPSRLLARGT